MAKKILTKRKSRKGSKKMTKKEARKILGVSRSMKLESIEKVYKELLSKFQLGMLRGNPVDKRKKAEEKLVQICNAWDALKPAEAQKKVSKKEEIKPGEFGQVEEIPRSTAIRTLSREESVNLKLRQHSESINEINTIMDLIEKSGKEKFHEIGNALDNLERKLKKSSRLIRRVTVQSPNGATTCEETFSYEK
jgi:hypothetical protein